MLYVIQWMTNFSGAGFVNLWLGSDFFWRGARAVWPQYL